jgi:nucleotide-binding universal stress UspA family protein
MPQPVLIAAIDLGPLTGRVLYHAAGFARLLNLKLRVLHVSPDLSPAMHDAVVETCCREAPLQMQFESQDVMLRPGVVADVIAEEAQHAEAPLIVMGAHGRTGVASLLLGSTSKALLRKATAPVLLVPPTDMDIVSVGNTVTLTSGPIIAAVDLSQESGKQLVMASLLARLGRQPLKLMTVATNTTPVEDANAQLQQRGSQLYPKRASAVIVRRGAIPAEIARCASTEHSGLVVMGLRSTPTCQPGSIANAVLKTKKAFVLAVPGCWTMRRCAVK